MTPGDDALVRSFLKGDSDSFETLFKRHEQGLFAFILGLGGRWFEAEDVAQTTWQQVIRYLPDYKAKGRFRSWLFRIAHRTWLNHVGSAWERRHTMIGAAGDEDFAALPIDLATIRNEQTPRDSSIASEERLLLYEALDNLPNFLRRCALLRLSGEMTYAEIAEEMECSVATAHRRVKEAEVRIWKLIGERDESK